MQSNPENQKNPGGQQENGEIPQTGVAAGTAQSLSDAAVEALDKRSPRKPAKRILEQQLTEGKKELERSASGLFMSGLSAGLDVGFSVFLMATLMTLDKGALPRPITEIMVAMAYALGFILVILGRSELFTEHTALAVLPVLNGRATILQLLRLWVIVFVANSIGGAIFSLLAAEIGPALGVIEPTAFGEIAKGVISHPGWVILLSAVLAGWLMGLLSWLVTASRETTSQILVILLITTTIGLTHLHHAVAGTVEVLTGLFAGQGITVSDYLYFAFWTVLGNSIGGVFFVAVIKYGQAIKSSREAEEVSLE